jgi:hypothetical protein
MPGFETLARVLFQNIWIIFHFVDENRAVWSNCAVIAGARKERQIAPQS